MGWCWWRSTGRPACAASTGPTWPPTRSLPCPLHVSLFGSAARGDGDTTSDLDLLVIRPDTPQDDDDDIWDEQLFASGERVVAATGNLAAWFVTTPADLRRAVDAGEPVIGEWRRDGIHLAGRRLEALLREAA